MPAKSPTAAYRSPTSSTSSATTATLQAITHIFEPFAEADAPGARERRIFDKKTAARFKNPILESRDTQTDHYMHYASWPQADAAALLRLREKLRQ